MGSWRVFALEVAEVAVSYFEKLYMTSHPDRIMEVVEAIDPKVTVEMNQTFELMHYLDNKRDGEDCYMAIKLDMSKAYDRLECGFIEQVRKKLGFHDSWICLIMRCITSISYSLLINGEAYGNIMPSRGLRQGDLLSSYLFLLFVDGLSSLISKAAINQLMSGLSICRGCPKITHLFFVNDSLLFCKANGQECHQLIDILCLYEAASGQKINSYKSSVFFNANTDVEKKNEILEILGPI
nr:uncharacterized protein LOC111999127 [Quercus suber]